jgi:hypothetical protein
MLFSQEPAIGISKNFFPRKSEVVAGICRNQAFPEMPGFSSIA